MGRWIYAVAAVLLAVIAYSWVLLLWQPPLEISYLGGWHRTWPAWSVPFFGLWAALVVLMLWLRNRVSRYEEGTYGAPQPRDSAFFAIGVAAWGMAGLLALGVTRGTLEALPAALALACATGALIATTFALDALRRGEGIGISSHWGGLGGGIGGWRVTPAASATLLALVFLAATLTIGARGGDGANNQSGNQVTANDQANAADDNVAENDADATTANEAGSNAVGGNEADAAVNGTAGTR
jgi:hypothetical protein